MLIKISDLNSSEKSHADIIFIISIQSLTESLNLPNFDWIIVCATADNFLEIIKVYCINFFMDLKNSDY